MMRRATNRPDGRSSIETHLQLDLSKPTHDTLSFCREPASLLRRLTFESSNLNSQLQFPTLSVSAIGRVPFDSFGNPTWFR